MYARRLPSGATVGNAPFPGTLSTRAGRAVTLGAIYKTLGRLEAKGLLDVTVAPPTGERGGRRKKLYRLNPDGRAAVRGSLSDLRQLAEGLEPGLEVR